MNLFDIVVFAILVTSSLLGLQRGLFKLTVGLLCFILTLISTYFLFPITKLIVIEHVSNILAVNIISAVVSYIVAMVFFGIVSSNICKLLTEISGGLLDRLLGLGAGMLRGALITSMLFGVIAIFCSGSYIGATNARTLIEGVRPQDYPSWFKKSYSFDLLEPFITGMGKIVNKDDLAKIQLPSVKAKIPEVSSKIIETMPSAVKEEVQNIGQHKVDDVMSEVEKLIQK